MSRKPLRSPRLLRRVRREQRKKSIAAIFLALALLGGAFYLLMRPEFFITDIEVAGESPVPTEEIASLVEQELSGQYLFTLPKSSIFFYPRRAIEEALRSRFPILESAHVSLRNLGSVRVSLSLRRRVAEWCAEAGGDRQEQRCVFVDQTGFAFEEISPDAVPRYPRFLSRTAAGNLVGTVVLAKERLAAFLSLLRSLEPFGLAVSFLELQNSGELAVHLRSGGKLLLREDGGFSDALTRLETLLAEKNLVPRDSGDGLLVEYIDLRYGNKIYFKPR